MVVLGNHEKRIWSREDRYAPVLSAASSRLLTLMAIQEGRYLKQEDCKNTFCQPELPADELCIVKPPMGCLNLKKRVYWKLNITLYGLVRSAHHWYVKISEILKK